MSKHINSGLHQLRAAFPKTEGWDVRGIGTHAAEVRLDMEYVGLISYDKTASKWAATNNGTLPDGSDRFIFDTPKAAALNYYMKLPDMAKKWVVDALKAS